MQVDVTRCCRPPEFNDAVQGSIRAVRSRLFTAQPAPEMPPQHPQVQPQHLQHPQQRRSMEGRAAVSASGSSQQRSSFGGAGSLPSVFAERQQHQQQEQEEEAQMGAVLAALGFTPRVPLQPTPLHPGRQAWPEGSCGARCGVGQVLRGSETDSMWHVAVSVRGSETARWFASELGEELRRDAGVAVRLVCSRLATQQLAAEDEGSNLVAAAAGRGRGTGHSHDDERAAAHAMGHAGGEAWEGADGTWVVDDSQQWVLDCVPATGTPTAAARFALEVLLGVPHAKAHVIAGGLLP